MKTRFKLLTCAIAAVLSTSAAAAAATTPGLIFTDSSWSLTAEDKARLEAAELRSTPEWREAFQEALLEGKSPVDPVRAVCEEVTDSGEIMPVYLDPASPASTDIKLELVYDASENGYNLWSGRFIVSEVRSFASVFYEPKTFGCDFDNNYKDGQVVAEIKSRDDYILNYKSVVVKGIYDKGGERYTKTAENDGNSQVVNAYIKDSGGGRLVEGAYYFYLHDGSGSGSNYKDVAVIHVVDKDYAASAEYAAKPYAGLIDHYTYVDTENMGVASPINEE